MTCHGLDVAAGTPLEVVFDTHIREVRPSAQPADAYLAPGFIDIQVNGFAGADYNNPSEPHEAIARSIAILHETGVTRFYPTIITGSPENMAGSLANMARAKDSLPDGSTMEAFHVEGPHISPDDGPRGAHPQRWVRKPDIDEYRRWQDAAQGNIRLITLSPEWPEAPHYIETIVKDGVVASIGHTKADRQQIQDAVSAGATFSTHLGNGAHQVLHRHPNYIWEQLADDRLMAGFIVDGIHLAQSFMRVAVRAKGVERSVLVTDASSPAAAKPGRYMLGEQAVDLTEDDRVVLADTERLAGSGLRMDRGLENLMKLVGLSLPDAVRMATVNPAKGGRIPRREQGLAAGDRADLVLFRFDAETKSVEILETYVSGKKVYQAGLATRQ
jgi:N-acetylglucosamine-6-phosphate deacetylase